MVQAFLSAILSKVGVSLGSGFVMFLLGRFWRNLVRPSIESLWYRGTRLERCYTGEFTLAGQKKTDIVELKQRAYRVWGTMTFPEGIEGKYKFEATLNDNVLRGTYEGVVLTPCARGSFLLRLTPGKRELEGWFVEPLGNEVLALEYRWIPKRS